MKKQGKRSKKKHLSKEAFRKIRYKQHMWRLYKHTGKDKDYDAYKEALHAATNEVRKSKRNVKHKLAQHIKSDSKSFYAYVRSKQNVRDRVGPLEDSAGNIITQGVLMADELNMHFSSVFTREDTSSLPGTRNKVNTDQPWHRIYDHDVYPRNPNMSFRPRFLQQLLHPKIRYNTHVVQPVIRYHKPSEFPA